ncbi:MAG: DUF721 domain-containing protein [Planctomycetaceae bacterium]|nr:DUF721 domain-containing protein [Planctomycetaceae bacterium]
MSPKRASTKKNSTGAVRIGEILPQIFARYGMHRQLDHDALLQAWTEAVAPYLPDSLQGISQPGSVKRGALEVQVPHAAIVQELFFHEKEILATLSQKVPDRKIRKIRFLVEG